MRILLYRKNAKLFSKSGIGRAMKHQEQALQKINIPYTTNPKDSYDVVHINTVDPDAWFMIKSAKLKQKKVVMHAHSTKEDFQNSFVLSNQLAPLFKWHLVNMYKKGDLILTPTLYSKKILESYGIKNRIVAISNGIDLKTYARDEKKVAAFREHFNLTEKQKVVLSVGLYFERKGLHDFIEIARSFPSVTFIWFGYTAPASTTTVIKDAIKNKPDNVILPGYIAGDIIRGAFSCADVFFFPSYEETEGIVVLEALASRCQVLVRDIGVYEGWLENGVNCYMGTDNASFTVTLEKLLNHTVASTIDAGYEVAESRSIDKIGIELKNAYEEVLKK